MKPSLFTSKYLTQVQNGRIFHVTQHLEGCRNLFSFLTNVQEYLHHMQRAREKTGVFLLYYVIMPNHVHFLLMAENNKGPAKFMQNINTGFCRRMKNLDKSLVLPIFSGTPSYMMIQSVKHFWECLRYVHKNPVVWNKKYSDYQLKIKDDAYWGSAAWNMRGKSFPNFDFHQLLEICGMSWPELAALLNGSRKDFEDFLNALEIDEEREKKTFYSG